MFFLPYFRKHGDLACISSFQTEWKIMCLSTFCPEVVATGLRKLYSIITFDGLVKDVSYTISMFLFKLERLSDTSHLKLLDLCSLISVLFIHRLP